jgi:3-dehydroquinate synthase
MRRFDTVLKLERATTRIVVGTGLLGEVGARTAALDLDRRALVITDETVGELYGADVLGGLDEAGFAHGLLTLPAGDRSKSLASAERAFEMLASMRLGRDGVVIGLGGGMVTDLAGFVGATWLRGVATVLCPTTLEADVDAAIGGKTAVNLPFGKNLVGAFHHPRLVLADTACLGSLGDRDLSAGLAESVKHAAITPGDFLAWHEANADAILARDDDVLVELVRRNMEIKGEVVARDERETTGARAMLNYGHTIGHALESAGTFSLRHGECVSIGMVAAGWIACELGMLDGEEAERIERLLRRFNLPVRLPESETFSANAGDFRSSAARFDSVRDYLSRDKKVVGGVVRFVLLNGLGQPVLRDDVGEALIRKAIERIG